MRRQICCSIVPVSCTFWFSVTLIPLFPICFLSTLVFTFAAQMKFCLLWSSLSFCFCPTVVDFISSLILFFQFSSISLFPYYLSSFLRAFSFFLVAMRGYVVFSLFITWVFHLVFFSVFVLSLFSPSLLQFFCAKMKRSLLSAVCCLLSVSVSSGSLPHAASLTAWVKQTDPLRIANMLRGNRLNYAHCGGEDIHNTGIKVLKVMQYLALQLPAVCRISGMFCQTDMHMSYSLPVLAVRLNEWTTQLLAYIGLQWSQERYKMTVCWQALLPTSKWDFNTLTISEPYLKNILFTWQDFISMCRDFDSV